MKHLVKYTLNYFTKFEWSLLLGSLVLILTAHFLCGVGDWLKLLASLIGTVALIFNAKGNLIGQVLVIVFGCLYGYISCHFQYYGEAITYLGMSVPMAIAALVSWAKHPYQGKRSEVEVGQLRRIECVEIVLLALIITAAFYFILRFLGTSNLAVSTLSVGTSFLAACFSFKRSPYYALGYALNDLVLIVLWILATPQDLSCLSMVVCFTVFLVNDLYGFFCWKLRGYRQNAGNLCVQDSAKET